MGEMKEIVSSADGSILVVSLLIFIIVLYMKR